LQGPGAMSTEQEKQKWPFDPMQPGDHEPVRIPDDHPSKQHEQQRPDPKPE
jgi:hypothetical protein